MSKLWGEAASSPRVDAAVWEPAVQAALEMQPEEMSQSDSDSDSEVGCSRRPALHSYADNMSVVEVGPHQCAFRAALQGVLQLMYTTDQHQLQPHSPLSSCEKGRTGVNLTDDRLLQSAPVSLR